MWGDVSTIARGDGPEVTETAEEEEEDQEEADTRSPLLCV